MARQTMMIGYLPAVLAATTGIVAAGLLGAPVAIHPEASGCFMTKDGSQCVDLPDPTSVGCPAGDFKCFFEKKRQEQPPPG